ncbi:MAG: hypothetical protein QF561_07040 [Phycisphaerales bacterium]|jgi:hypothetical protein|nr:hypothetical protein [Phycisphaerales bacterium]
MRCSRKWCVSAVLAAAAVVLPASLGLMWTPTAAAIGSDRSEYLAVTARSGRGEEEALWIFDTRTEELIVVAWDREASTMRTLDRREVSQDLLRVEAGR